jgi:hypothetical protein
MEPVCYLDIIMEGSARSVAYGHPGRWELNALSDPTLLLWLVGVREERTMKVPCRKCPQIR